MHVRGWIHSLAHARTDLQRIPFLLLQSRGETARGGNLHCHPKKSSFRHSSNAPHQVLSLRGNLLDNGAVAVLAAATHLERLDLGDNALTAFPATLSTALPMLWRLDLRNNRIGALDWSAFSGDATRHLRVRRLRFRCGFES